MTLPAYQNPDLAKARLEQLYGITRDRMKGVVDLSLLGLRSLLLLNGGAVVSLFTVLGHYAEIGVRADRLWLSFACFVVGLVLNMVGLLFGFLSQNEFAAAEYTEATRAYFEATIGIEQPHMTRSTKNGTWQWITAISLVVASLIAFVCGSAFALIAVQHVVPHHT